MMTGTTTATRIVDLLTVLEAGVITRNRVAGGRSDRHGRMGVTGRGVARRHAPRVDVRG